VKRLFALYALPLQVTFLLVLRLAYPQLVLQVLAFAPPAMAEAAKMLNVLFAAQATTKPVWVT